MGAKALKISDKVAHHVSDMQPITEPFVNWREGCCFISNVTLDLVY